MEKKFIKTTDKTTADKLIVCGFRLISHVGNMYTFLNEAPIGFTFDAADKKYIVYDNTINI